MFQEDNKEDNVDELLRDLVDVSLLWDRLGAIYGYIEAPWVPTPMDIVEHVLEAVSVGPKDVVIDLGCGDGRVVIEAAKRGARSICVEIDEKLIEIARNNARQQGVEERIEFINSDILEVDISSATVVYVYLTSNVLSKLKNKMVNELRPGTTVVSLDYEIEWLEPVEIIDFTSSDKYRKVYIYIL